MALPVLSMAHGTMGGENLSTDFIDILACSRPRRLLCLERVRGEGVKRESYAGGKNTFSDPSSSRCLCLSLHTSSFPSSGLKVKTPVCVLPFSDSIGLA